MSMNNCCDTSRKMRKEADNLEKRWIQLLKSVVIISWNRCRVDATEPESIGLQPWCRKSWKSKEIVCAVLDMIGGEARMYTAICAALDTLKTDENLVSRLWEVRFD